MAEEPGAQPGGRPVEQPGAQPAWLPVAAAARRLGVTQQAIRRRIERGTLETRREVVGNRSRLLVRVEQPVEQPGAPAVVNAEVAELHERVARLEEQLAAAERRAAERAGFEEAIRTELRRQVDQARADLERERRRAEASERRRPWPGLRRWLRRPFGIT